jgi:hypothetical protein
MALFIGDIVAKASLRQPVRLHLCEPPTLAIPQMPTYFCLRISTTYKLPLSFDSPEHQRIFTSSMSALKYCRV